MYIYPIRVNMSQTTINKKVNIVFFKGKRVNIVEYTLNII